MAKPFFRDWDSFNKYIKASWQSNYARIGHLEYLYDYLTQNSLADWVSSEEGYSAGEVVFATNGIYRSDVDNNTTAPPSSGWTLLASISSSYTPPYKVYTALLNQSGTNAPVATVLENTLGGDVVWEYESAGSYAGNSPSLFTLNKTAIFTGQNYQSNGNEHTYAYTTGDISKVRIETTDGNAVLINDNLLDTMIEIRVYE